MSTASTVPATAGDVKENHGSLHIGDLEVNFFDSVDEHSGLPPIVLVHGTGGSTRSHFGFLFPMLAAKQRVVAVDLATPQGPPDEGQIRMAEQVQAVIEKVLPDRPVTLAGYSLGAVVAATAAGTRPDLVGGLILMAGWLKTDAQQKLRNDVWRALRQSDVEALRRYQAFCAFSAPLLAMLSDGEIEALVSSFRTDDVMAAQMEINRHVDLTDVAPKIACPTLIVAGTDDLMTPFRQSKRLFGAIADARYTEVTSGHAMVVERPAELVHLIAAFNANPNQYPAGAILPARRP
ncbi:alpha/beta hydrolase [Planobispora longispora]|uniref:Alpha/beta hydrolase n=1 Tax=Planobispora longispora TaxID=28887 RepID=A0A8J3RNF2_9ACTN|nr:alpha/beta hydrolase [Planobispora longispora]